MSAVKPKQLRWVKEARVPPRSASPAAVPTSPTARERLVATLADRPQTIAQLAQTFGLSQPTVLDQVRRAVRDGLIVEVPVAAEEKRFAAERYYAPAVPVIRQPDRELLESACRGLAREVAAALARHEGDLQAAFAMTTLAREGRSFAELLPYLQETVQRLVWEQGAGGRSPRPLPSHGLAWVEVLDAFERSGEPAGARDERDAASA